MVGLRCHRAAAPHHGPATRTAAPQLAPVDYLSLDVDGRGVDELRNVDWKATQVYVTSFLKEGNTPAATSF